MARDAGDAILETGPYWEILKHRAAAHSQEFFPSRVDRILNAQRAEVPHRRKARRTDVRSPAQKQQRPAVRGVGRYPNDCQR